MSSKQMSGANRAVFLLGQFAASRDIAQKLPSATRQWLTATLESGELRTFIDAAHERARQAGLSDGEVATAAALEFALMMVGEQHRALIDGMDKAKAAMADERGPATEGHNPSHALGAHPQPSQ